MLECCIVWVWLALLGDLILTQFSIWAVWMFLMDSHFKNPIRFHVAWADWKKKKEKKNDVCVGNTRNTNKIKKKKSQENCIILSRSPKLSATNRCCMKMPFCKPYSLFHLIWNWYFKKKGGWGFPGIEPGTPNPCPPISRLALPRQPFCIHAYYNGWGRIWTCMFSLYHSSILWDSEVTGLM